MNAEFDFDKMSGLLPAVVQDSSDGEVLMVGFMNRQAVERTLEGGYVTFFSRTRQQFWIKGESSGNRLRVLLDDIPQRLANQAVLFEVVMFSDKFVPAIFFLTAVDQLNRDCLGCVLDR